MSTGARRKPAAARVPAPVAALPSAVGSAVLERELDWFEGVLLLALYAILAIAFFHVPAG